MGCDIPDVSLTVSIGKNNIFCVKLYLYAGLPKDTWELSQQAGRGGRNGNQAAFVIMLWPGQTGLCICLYLICVCLYLFVSYCLHTKHS